jgi:NADPH2:quinone reductase
LLLIQWLKHLQAKVIGTVSTEDKAKIAREAGADHIILYTQQDFVEETKKITNGQGAAYIIDGVGKSTFTKDLDAARRHGWICLFGSASGAADPLAPNALQAKSLTISGGSLFNFLNTREELLMRADAVLAGIRAGWLKLRIDHVFSLDKAAEAQQMLEGRQTVGKVILKMGEG